MSQQDTRPFVVGTRGSALALWQAEYVVGRLRGRFPGRDFVIKTVHTRGDAVQSVSLAEIGTRGVFVKEIQSALLAGEIDLGVHSLKDLPSEVAPGLVLAATTPREDPRDALVSRHACGLADLPRGARLGTSSPRRAAQLRRLRADFVLDTIRGNVDTRVRKALNGEFDGVVLAAAGLHRLGMAEQVAEYLPFSTMVPAPGQGIIAVEAREGDAEALAVAAVVEDRPARLAAEAERAFVRALGGGCYTPLAAHATVRDGSIEMVGLLASPEGDTVVEAKISGDAGDPVALGTTLARQILAAGGEAIVQRLAREGGL